MRASAQPVAQAHPESTQFAPDFLADGASQWRHCEVVVDELRDADERKKVDEAP